MLHHTCNLLAEAANLLRPILRCREYAPPALHSVSVYWHSSSVEDPQAAQAVGWVQGHTRVLAFYVHGGSLLVINRSPWLCRQPQCGAILWGSANSSVSALLADSPAVHTGGFRSPPPACKYPCAAGSIRKPEPAQGCARTDAAQGSFGARTARNQSAPPDCRCAFMSPLYKEALKSIASCMSNPVSSSGLRL